MKVKDLAAMLLQCNPESEVSFQMISGCCGDCEYMEVAYRDMKDYSKHYDGSDIHMVIEFYPLPGYQSCIQAGGTIELHKKYWEERNPSVLEKIKNRTSL